jgi:tRNA threonylcarbamoyladenosine biosynthesis protein TsaB
MSSFMTQQCLAFDCAVTGLSAAVLRGEACLARTSAPGRDQAARLLPAIEALLKEAGVGRREIGLIAVTIGPGSFTGVRVGLATARGLALALDVPLAGLPTTSVLLAQAPADLSRLAVAAIDSRLGDWFCAIAGDEPPFLAAADALAARLTARLGGGAVTLVGPEAEALAVHLRTRGLDVAARQELPDAVCLARLALARGAAHWKAQGMPRPLYLRGVNVTSPDGARRTVE